MPCISSQSVILRSMECYLSDRIRLSFSVGEDASSSTSALSIAAISRESTPSLWSAAERLIAVSMNSSDDSEGLTYSSKYSLIVLLTDKSTGKKDVQRRERERERERCTLKKTMRTIYQ